jgi:hypothetical protein
MEAPFLLPVSPTAFFWCLVFDGRSLRVKSDGATLDWRGQGMSDRALPDRRKGYSSVSNFPVPDEIGPLLAAYDHRSVGHQRGERVLFDAVPPSPVRNVAAAHRKSATGSSGTPSDRARSREVLRASVRPPLNRSCQHHI